MSRALAILAGAALLTWPALVNQYPLVFSDTAGLAAMGLEPEMGWDKPWVYGPLILLLHWGWSLWGVVAGQVLAVSLILWGVGRVTGPGRAWSHVALCAVLAVGSAAPWFATFVMPDIFAPLTVLCMVLVAWGGLGWAALLAVTLLAAISVASHLAHLFVAAGCLAAVAITRPRRLLPCAAPLVMAVAWLLGSNWIGNRVLGLSPYGSVFALARLQADGPAADYIHRACPAAGYRVCAWSSQLPMDSDAFLWSPDGPMFADEFGPTLFAPEANRIVAATLRAAPLRAAGNAVLNTGRQLVRVAVGDTLGPQHLVSTVGLLMRTYFPPAETARFLASRQVAGRLGAVAEPLLPVHLALLVLGAAGSLLLATRAWARDPALGCLALVTLFGVLGNAFATGALSGPHDRYGARIAWLLVVPPTLWLLGLRSRQRAAMLQGEEKAV